MKVVLKVRYKYMRLEDWWTCSFIKPICGEGVRMPVVTARGTCHSCKCISTTASMQVVSARCLSRLWTCQCAKQWQWLLYWKVGQMWRCEGWFGFFMHKVKYKLKFTGWLSFCIRNMWRAVNKFPIAAEHFKIAKLVILMSHKQVDQE